MSMFFLLKMIVTGVLIYACLNFEKKRGVLGLIFRTPIITSLLISVIVFVSLIVSSQINIMSTINTGEVSIIGIKVFGYILFIGVSLIVTLLISKFAKNRVINEDKSVSIINSKVSLKNKSGVIILLILFFIITNILSVGEIIDKNREDVEKRYKEIAQKYKNNSK